MRDHVVRVFNAVQERAMGPPGVEMEEIIAEGKTTLAGGTVTEAPEDSEEIESSLQIGLLLKQITILDREMELDSRPHPQLQEEMWVRVCLSLGCSF